MDCTASRLGYTLAVLLTLGVATSMAVAAPGGQLGAGLSTGQKVDKVSSALQKVKATLKFTLKRLNRARDNKDIIQVNCVNDKLAGVKGFLKIAERAQKGLLEAKREGDVNLVQHEFAKVMLIRDRIENLKLQVEGCIGEISQYTGNRELTVAVDPDIRSDDPTATEAVPTFDALNIVRPPAVTGSE